MMFTLNRNKTVTAHGHAIEFKKGVPTYVPYAAIEAVVAAGGTSEEELPEEEVRVTLEPSDAGKRKQLILDTMARIAKTNSREDFTGTGIPTMPALTRELGFKIDTTERDALWVEVLQSRA